MDNKEPRGLAYGNNVENGGAKDMLVIVIDIAVVYRTPQGTMGRHSLNLAAAALEAATLRKRWTRVTPGHTKADNAATLAH